MGRAGRPKTDDEATRLPPPPSKSPSFLCDTPPQGTPRKRCCGWLGLLPGLTHMLFSSSSSQVLASNGFPPPSGL